MENFITPTFDLQVFKLHDDSTQKREDRKSMGNPSDILPSARSCSGVAHKVQFCKIIQRAAQPPIKNMRCHHSLLFLLGSAACAIQSRADMSPQDISESINALKSMGILGVENLCLPTDELVPLIPKCKEDSTGSIGVSLNTFDECWQQERHGLFRGAKILRRNLNESSEKVIGLKERKLDNEADEVHNAEFYIINIGGTLVR